MSNAENVDPNDKTAGPLPDDLPDDPRESYRREPSTEWRTRKSSTSESGSVTWGIRQVMEQETVGISFRSSAAPGGRLNPADLIPPQAGPCSTYILRQCVGMGGFGEVWEAVQASLGRTVAVKKIQDTHYAEIEDDEEEVLILDDQFRQEAYITAQLDHPNIVPIYDLGTDDNGHPLLAMKLVKGTPWNQLLRVDSDKLDLDDYLHKHLTILLDMAQAVAFAHSRSIVHRDLKPSQVIVGAYGEVLLMDWGLAVFVGDPEEDLKTLADLKSSIPTPITASSPGGTPCLMAPEQTQPTAEEITTLTDMYLLGGCLYFVLTGTYPHDDRTSYLSMARARKGEITDPRERVAGRYVPAELAELAMKCLEKHPENRLQTAEEFIRHIQEYLSGSTNRRDSLRLTARVADRLVGLDTGVHPLNLRDSRHSSRDGSENDGRTENIYGDFTECLNLLQQAVAKWSRNPDVDTLREMVLSRYSRSAIAHGDLTLAGALADQIIDREESETVHEEVAALHRRTARIHEQRKVAVVGALLLMAVLVVGGMKYAMDQHKSAANLAVERDIARASREAADRARLRATREQYFSSIGIADATLQQGRIEKTSEMLLNRVPQVFANWEWGHLMSQVQREDLSLNSVDVFDALFSPDAATVVTSDAKGVARWSAATGAPLWHTPVGTQLLWSVAISPDGHWIAGVSRDNSAYLLGAVSGNVMHRLEGHTEMLRGVDFSPDSKRLATCGADETVRLWDAITGTPGLVIEDFGDDVYDVRFSPDGQALAVATLGNRAALYDSTTGSKLAEYKGHPENVLGIAFHPSGEFIATAGSDRNIRIFETETGELLRVFRNEAAYLHDIDISPDGELIATADDAGLCTLWDFKTGNRITSVQADDPMWKVHFSPNGKRLVTTSRRSVRVFSLERLLPSYTLDPKPTMTELRDATVRVRAYGVHEARSAVWRNRDRKWLVEAGATIARQDGQEYAVLAMDSDFSEDYARLVRVDRATQDAVVIDSVTGELLGTLVEDTALEARFSPGGRLIAVADFSDDVRLFDGKTLEPLGVLTRPEEMRKSTSRGYDLIKAIAFHPSGESLVVSYNARDIVFWDLANRTIARQLEAEGTPGICFAFSADGLMLASGGTDDRITLWDLTTGDVHAVMTGHQRTVISAAFNPDGTRLASTAKDGTVKVWDTEAGREILTVTSNEDGRLYLGVAFTPNGRDLVMVSTTGIEVANSFPWNMGEYPHPASASMTFSQQIEWWKRLNRSSPNVTAEDVLATAPSLSTD
ncbi:MAG: hypothetical protein PWP23_452 [Candidatus Sumerlaeota bacterium]|nr:hypothetical protein [Candidatus Sumerlaeota bacterium]